VRKELHDQISSVQVKAPNTTADDLSRIIHMLADTSLQVKFQEVFSTMDRQELDDKENRDEKKRVLADVYNDYAAYNYKNRSSVIKDGRLVAAPNMDAVFDMCSDLNPSKGFGNPNVYRRDHIWLFDNLSKLRARYVVALTNYHKSGNQDEEDKYAEFIKFCKGDMLMLYFFVVFGGDSVTANTFLAKMLPDDISFESGATKDKKDNKAPKPKRPSPEGDDSGSKTKRIDLHVRIPEKENRANSAVTDADMQLLEFHSKIYNLNPDSALGKTSLTEIERIQTAVMMKARAISYC
jgi:MoaA/NifB/PqqE/SkfB family radical SAM enzyme